MYEIIFIIKNIVYILLVILFIVNNGNILTSGDKKNERECVQRELQKREKLIQCTEKR